MAEPGGAVAVGRGVSHPGHIRPKNEDRYLIDDELGLYAVFDGMGGHSAGDVAAALARDVIVRYVAERRHRRTPRKLLDRAFQRASAAVHRESQRRRDRYGMGTTAVVALVSADRSAVIASAGDSRAYLVRDGALRLLTRDQTVVNELVAAGSLSPQVAENHPYRSVLSNNIGARQRTHVQLADLTLEEGDRLLLCSDGLTGFASLDAMAEIAVGASDAERAAADLVELALHGGGGDNVTAVVVEGGAPQVAAQSSVEVRRALAEVWWQHRPRFLEAAAHRGLAASPICASVSGDEALELVGGNLADAVKSDLANAGVEHAEVFAENLASGWIARGGSYPSIHELFDCLRVAVCDVVADLREARDPLADAVEAGAYRSLAGAEGAVGRLVARRLRALETAIEEARRVRDARSSERVTISDHATIPDASTTPNEPPDPDVIQCLEAGFRTARGEVGRGGERAALERAHQIATSELSAAERRDLVGELCGNLVLDEASAVALFAAADRAREAHVAAIRRAPGEPAARAAAMERVAMSHQGIAAGVAAIAVDAGRPLSDDLAASAEHVRALRARVFQADQRLTKLEEALAALAGQPIDTLVSDGGGG